MYQQIRAYCWSDVLLLAKGMLKFRQEVMTSTLKDGKGVDPFLVAITIASLCNYVWRYDCLQSETVAIIPENGYNAEQKTSVKAQYFIKYLSIKNKINIDHARNRGELKINGKFIDGYDR